MSAKAKIALGIDLEDRTRQTGKRKLPDEALFQIEMDFEESPICMRHMSRLASLDMIHGDPFDRLLNAQGAEESLTMNARGFFIHQYNTNPILA